ncbi:MAG: hypothetical protein HUU56_05465 [Bdellovibrionaceae bacterium]|nr:hypothetical protein [Pseudobdellovibrionaceae bacterium]
MCLFRFILMFFFIVDLTFADLLKKTDSIAVESPKQKKESSWLGFPLVYYTPETKLALGLLSLNRFSKEAQGKTSNLLAVGSYTEKQQSILSLTPRFYFDEGRKELSGNLFYSYYPNKYFGRSDYQVNSNSPENYTENNFNLMANYTHHIFSYFNTLWTVRTDKKKFINYLENGQIAEEVNRYGQEIKIHSLSFSLEWDSRDYPQSPLSGEHHRVTLTKSQNENKTFNDFTKKELELKKFFSLGDKKVLAGQFYFSQVEGEDIPFSFLSSLGGNRRLRGFYENRFLDRSLTLFQLEWREDFSEKFSRTLFLASGQVAKYNEDLLKSKNHMAFGIGLHYLLDHENRTKIRLDLGSSEEGLSIYFVTGEAF